MAKKLNKLDSSFKQWQTTSTPESLSAVFKDADSVIQAGLRSYGGVRGRNDPIMRMEAINIVRDALDRYQPEKGVQLNTYLTHNLKGLARVAHQRAQELKIPQRAWFDLQNINGAIDEFTVEYEREPSALELADLTGLSTGRIRYLEQFKKTGVPESVLRERSPTEFRIPTQEEPSDFWGEAVYYSLPPVDQLVFDYRLGKHGKSLLTNKEIALRLRISPSAVSQRVSRILALVQKGAHLE